MPIQALARARVWGGGYGLKRLSEIFYYCIFNRKHECFNGHYQNVTIYLWNLSLAL